MTSKIGPKEAALRASHETRAQKAMQPSADTLKALKQIAASKPNRVRKDTKK